MTKRVKKPSVFTRFRDNAATHQQQVSQKNEAFAQQRHLDQAVALVLIDQIQPRSQDTRRVDPEHALNVAESVAALGLLEPLVVDRRYRLLAGLHRLEACRLVMCQTPEERLDLWQRLHAAVDKTPDPELEARVRALQPGLMADQQRSLPVRRMDFDADDDPQQAFAVEVAENEQRRDYSPAEIRAIAERLTAAGFTSGRAGRPKKHERALMPALEAIVGRKRVAIWRALKSADTTTPSRSTASRPGTSGATTIKRVVTRFTKSQDWAADDPRRQKLDQLTRELIALLQSEDPQA